MTTYLVLVKKQNGWTEFTQVDSTSRQSAIHKALDNSTPTVGKESQGGEFVAVPARSWQPVKVQVETKTALKFS